MSKEAMKLALEAIENMSTALREDDVLGNDIDMLLDAITALQEALAEQPHEIGARLACEGKGISDLWGAVKSDADMAEAQRGYEAALAQQPAQQEPVAYDKTEQELFLAPFEYRQYGYYKDEKGTLKLGDIRPEQPAQRKEST